MTTTPPSSDLDDLYRRAIADPSSISRDESNTIKGWPPPDEEDRLCVSRTGSTRAELVAKAVAHPDNLSRDECEILQHPRGVLFDEDKNLPLDQRLERMRRARTDRNPLQDQAWDALLGIASEDMKQADQAARMRLLAIERTINEEQKRLWKEREREQGLRQGTPWMKDMLAAGLLEDGADCWGYVVFRTGCYDDDAAWGRFQAYFYQAGEATVLHWNSGPLLWPSFRAIFVSDRKMLDGASTEQLRARFKAMRDSGELPKGIRTNCFLIADATAIGSEAIGTPYEVLHGEPGPTVFVHAADPDYRHRLSETATGGAQDGNIEKVDEMKGFTGEVTLALPKAFDWLHWVCFNAERQTGWANLDRRSGWEAIYHETKTPSNWTPLFAPNSGGVEYYIAPATPPSWMQPPADLVAR
ncbi:hypothetical protein GQ53DRAFT_749574 [Thozetella sp. PMI_491]|nr:hypothetical protein GQ53DRAFT_749574 [Thozetella sp. PMI_491]